MGLQDGLTNATGGSLVWDELELVAKGNLSNYAFGTLFTSPSDRIPRERHGEAPKLLLPHCEGFNPLFVGIESMYVRWSMFGQWRRG